MGICTEDFAARRLVKPESVLSRLCRTGSYFGIRPRKLENGRLLWPDDAPGAPAKPGQRMAGPQQ
jgi:hypothetical protein